MLNRFDKRRLEANRIARKVMLDYGGDYHAAAERVLEFVDGQRWMEKMVLQEMRRIAGISERRYFRKAA